MSAPTRCLFQHYTARLGSQRQGPAIPRRSTELEDELEERPASFDELLTWRRDWLQRSDHPLTRWTESVGEVRRRSAAA